MSSEDVIHITKTIAENERERLFRTIYCTMFMFAFWLVFLWLLREHDNKIVMILLCLFSMMMIYILGSICFIVLVSKPFSQKDIENDEDGYEMTEQEEQQSTFMDTTNSDVDTESGLFAFPFGLTPNRIRACLEFANPDDAPSNGSYKIVCNAVAFGKQIRSEGTLHLTFTPFGKDRLHNTGWEIKGSSVFGKRTAMILDGFVNAKGHLYWTTPLLAAKQIDSRSKWPLKGVTIYRGKWDLNNQLWEDGEFQSLQEASNLSTRSEGRQKGRIVRMEFQSRTTEKAIETD
jgi:hypothetical protein